MPAREVVYLRQGGQVAASQTGLAVASLRMARSQRVRNAHIYCRVVSGTVTVDVQKNGATILTEVVTPSAVTQVAATLDLGKTAFAVGDTLEFKVTTASASTLDDGAVTIDLG